MLDMQKLPGYITTQVVDSQTYMSSHTERLCHDMLRIGYEFGRSEKAMELAEELKKYLPGNGWVQLLIDKLEDPDR